MGAVVQFSFAAFIAQYPQLTPIGSTLAQQYFDIATGIHRNDGGGPISDPAQQLRLLNMLTAHIASLYAPRDSQGNPAATGVPSPNITGRISSASEGSVSVSTEALEGFETAQASWLSQTVFGQLYWASTAFVRSVHYRPFPNYRRMTH